MIITTTTTTMNKIMMMALTVNAIIFFVKKNAIAFSFKILKKSQNLCTYH